MPVEHRRQRLRVPHLRGVAVLRPVVVHRRLSVHVPEPAAGRFGKLWIVCFISVHDVVHPSFLTDSSDSALRFQASRTLWVWRLSRGASGDNMQPNHVFGVNSTLPPLSAAFVIASLTWSKP